MADPRETGKSDLTELQDQVAFLRRENETLRQLTLGATQDSRLAAIITSSDDAIISKTLQGVIQTWNKGAERIFGWTEEEVVGKPISILIPPDRQQEEPDILQRLTRGERVDHFETVRMRKDGTLVDISVTISPVRNEEGIIVAASKIARDVTLQKQILQQLKEAKDEAERANQTKDQFLSVLSHELRTPLTPVLAEMSFLEEMADLPEGLRKSVAMVRRNVETEARLVDDLLDVTRIARSKLHLHQEVVGVNETVRAVVGMMQSQIDDKGIELAVALRAKEHHVWADAGRLQQVFLNLLSNAVKFTAQNGTISLRTWNEQNGTRIRIEVKDNGVGIEDEMMPRLFSAFEQGDRSRRFGGLGLGLSIARSLVELQGGQIIAHSGGLGHGSTFTVDLPATEVEGNSLPLHSGFQAEPLGLRVLLVEDHMDTRAAMHRLLAALGCKVEVAGSVREAMDIGERGTFDLLISDIGLPDGSGTEVMRRLRSDHLKGIAVSGFGQEEDVQRSRDAGFEAHMTKPVNFKSLREMVYMCAEKRV